MARALSLGGHPLILLPVAAMVKLSLYDGELLGISLVVAIIAVTGLSIFAFSLWQVRKGRWADTDASVPSERRTLTAATLVFLIGGAASSWLFGGPVELICGLLGGAIIIVVAVAVARWLKLSLHTAFAVYAALLIWPLYVWALAAFALSIAISWSRLALTRHDLKDVVAGAVAGLAAGLSYIAAATI